VELAYYFEYFLNVLEELILLAVCLALFELLGQLVKILATAILIKDHVAALIVLVDLKLE